MNNVVEDQGPDDPHVRWPGCTPIDRAGAELAVELLERLEAVEGHPEFADLANLENWPREGLPYQNVMAEYVQRARAISQEAENAFLAVIGDLVAQVQQGVVPDTGNYVHMLEAKGADDDNTQEQRGS